MDTELLVNSTLSHYRIVSKIGAGGMGEVYLAEDTRLGRRVALKLLPVGLSDDEEARRRFTQEARAASALNHPNIITIYDIGSEDGHGFIAMEYVEGESLRSLISAERVEVKRALELIAQAASGLAAAHEAGILHRDIKPENLMVAHGSQLKILDFGLAKLVEKKKALLATDLTTATYLKPAPGAETEAGTILGTVLYMSPEQAQGHPLDHRTDIFSLGVVLQELLTGRRPFEGKSAIDVLHAIINAEPPSAVDVNPRVPSKVRDILDKALAKELSERYQHAGDFELDLRRLKRGIESNSRLSVQTKFPANPETWWARKRTVLALSILGILLVGGMMAATWMLGRASASPKGNVSLGEMTLTPLTVDPGYDGEPTFSPSGEIAYVTNRTENFEIFRKQISGGAEINLTENDADDVQPSFSPDGTQIAFVSTRESASQLIYRNANFPLQGGDIWVMSALGGAVRRIAASGNFPSWSRDGSAIIYTSGPHGQQKILSVPASGGEPREIPLTFKSGDVVQRNLFYPSYSADGRWVVFEAQQGDGIYVVSAGGGEPRQIARGRRPIWNDNSIIYSSAEPGKNFSLWQLPFSLALGQKAGEPMPLTVSRGRDTQAAVSRDGKLIAFAGQDVEFNIENIPFDAESGRLLGESTKITLGQSLNSFFDVTPDGRKVVFESHRGASYHIWKTDDKGLNQLTADANFDDHNPKWSPDGHTIAFARRGLNEAEGKYSLWFMSADGVNPHPVYPEVRNFRWMPDGERIVYQSTVDSQLYLFDVRSGSAQRLTDESGITGTFNISPDGQWVVYQSTLKRFTMYVRALQISGGPTRAVGEIAHDYGHPFFSPTGKWLYFQREHKNLYRVPGPTQGWREAEPEKVTNFDESGLFLEDPQISRDGRQLFYSRARITGDLWLMRIKR